MVTGAGMPQWQAEGLAEDDAHYDRGEAGALSPDVQRVTGANAPSVHDFDATRRCAAGSLGQRPHCSYRLQGAVWVGLRRGPLSDQHAAEASCRCCGNAPLWATRLRAIAEARPRYLLCLISRATVLELPAIGSSHAPTSCLCTGRNGSGHVALPLVVPTQETVGSRPLQERAGGAVGSWLKSAEPAKGSRGPARRPEHWEDTTTRRTP